MAVDITHTFPDDNIDPRDKGFDWMLQYCKAAWAVGSNTSYASFYNSATKYREIRDYALGKQSVTKYKKHLPADNLTDRTSVNRDGTVIPIIPTYRNKSLAKILQRQFEINAFAVDPLAQTEQDEKLNDLRVKIAMSNALKSVESPLQGHDSLRFQHNEPRDEEQLNMMLQFGWKHNICMDGEMAIDWALNYNKFPSVRKSVVNDLYDFGAGGYKIYMDETGKPRFRAVNIDNLVVSYCENPDFSDATFIGETIYVKVSDLVPYFDSSQIKAICHSVVGKYNNPPSVNLNVTRYYDNFQVLVLDLQFISYNTTVYEDTVDKYGNPRLTKTHFNNLDKIRGGEADPVYMKSTKKVIYQAKWIVGQELMYDYGLAKNQVRKESSWFDTQFDYVIESWNFNRMQFSGVTEGLIPLADDYYETQQKLQNIKRKLIPYMIEIDLDALEEVSFGKNGENFTPAQIIDLLFQSHILVYRGRDLLKGNNNGIRKPASIEATGMINELVMLRQELVAIKADMAEMSGYNAATLGNPNAKMLNAGYEISQAATNDSLWLISDTDKSLALRLSDMIIQKCQIAVKMGKIQGYARALGDSVVKMFQMNPDISLHEFAIFLEDSASPVERQQLIADMANFSQQGLLEPQDRIMIEYCRNLKYAQMLLSYLVNKRKIEQQRVAMQNAQQNAEIQQQSLMQKAQLEDAAADKEHQRTMEEINAKGYWDLQVSGLKNEGTQTAAQISGTAKVVTQQIIEDSKQSQKDTDFAMHTQKLKAMSEEAPKAPSAPEK